MESEQRRQQRLSVRTRRHLLVDELDLIPLQDVHFYELAFRQANIPYQTVLGRGFYKREEVTDLIQLLRFLDQVYRPTVR